MGCRREAEKVREAAAEAEADAIIVLLGREWLLRLGTVLYCVICSLSCGSIK